MNTGQLGLREILRMLRRRLWMIIAMPVLAGIVAGAVSIYLLAPVYSASTTLWVIKEGTGQINYYDLLMNRNLTKTYAEVAKSRAVMNDVIKRLNLPESSVNSLQSRLAVTPVRDTEILSFTVQDPDPKQAAALANAIAEAFKGQIRNYMKVETVAVVDAAQVPVQPISPRPFMNAGLAAVLALMTAAGLVFLMEYLDTSIKSPEDVNQYLGVPVLGIIPVITPEKVAEAPSRSNRSQTRKASVVTEK